MTPRPGYEWALRAVRERLEYALPEELLRQSAAGGDGVPLPPPAVYRWAPRDREPLSPAVYILPGVGSPDAQKQAWMDTTRRVVVIARLRGDDPDDLGVALLRYDAAVLRVLRGQGVMDDAVIVQWSESRPGPFFELDGENQWESWMSLTFTLRYVEELT